MWVLGSFLCFQTAWADDWQELKGDHFIIYHQKNESLAKATLQKAEGYYRHIADELGYARYSNFWQWENRAKIYIYPTAEDFRKASGQPEWSEGIATYDKKEILTYAWRQDFQDALLPHEITHLIFRDFVGFEGEIPLWLDEGVAQWQEPQKRQIAGKVAKLLVQSGNFYSLKNLTVIDVRQSTDEEAVHYFYMQSVSLVDFMVRRYGAQSFAYFCRQLRDGKSLDEALRFAYAGSIGGLQDLETKWKKYALEQS